MNEKENKQVHDRETLLIRLNDEQAADIGRLRRQAHRLGSLTHLVDRLADRAETIDCVLHPSAGELANITFPGDAETIEIALAIVELRKRQFSFLVGACP